MKKFLPFLLFISVISQVNGLVISEIMSNPTGDDSGREWIEIFNNTSESVDLSNFTISIKGGNAVVVTPLSGGTVLVPNGYAIIASTVSGSTKFLQDYPLYSGLLFKSSISLVNTGVTSVDIKLSGGAVDSLSSYTAAKEGYSLSLVNGTFALSNPTPGVENQFAVSLNNNTNDATSSINTQQVVQAQSSPSPDIVLYMPFEKTVVAGADTNFTTYGMTRAGNNIDDLTYVWSYGDGGQGTGTSTWYRYVYPGKYVAKVEATNGRVLGNASTKVRVVSPDIAITKIESGKYGNYVDISNPNNYDLDLSQWKLYFDGRSFPFPKNTIILGGETTRFSGIAMGFASTTISKNSVIKILFPNLEEVANYSAFDILNENINKVANTANDTIKKFGIVAGVSTTTITNISNKVSNKISTSKTTLNQAKQIIKDTSSSTLQNSSSTAVLLTNNSSKIKDTRIIDWLKSLFSF